MACACNYPNINSEPYFSQLDQLRKKRQLQPSTYCQKVRSFDATFSDKRTYDLPLL